NTIAKFNDPTSPYGIAVGLKMKIFRCPSTTDSQTYAVNTTYTDSGGNTVNGTVTHFGASYGAVQTGSTNTGANNQSFDDDGPFAGGGYKNSPAVRVDFRGNGPFIWGATYPITAIVDGASQTAAVGERYRLQQDPNWHGGRYGYFHIGHHFSADGHAQALG